MDTHILQSYELLSARWGPQHWWPAEHPLEMMIGAILTQNTAWSNVERAIANLRRHGALGLDALERVSTAELTAWIRPAGHFNQKTRYLKAMAAAIRSGFDGSLDQLFSLDTPALRNELLSWKGIGPETADSILLYAAKRPVFVVDAYTRRFLSRHGWCEERASYDGIAQLFTDNLPEDVQLFNEYHALIVRVGKEHCKTKPQCSGCPLEPLLEKPARCTDDSG